MTSSNIVVTNEDDDFIGLPDISEDELFPQSWAIVIVDEAIDDFVTNGLVSAFKQHGFPELASENDFGGPKFIKATQEELSMTYDEGRWSTAATLFDLYNKLGVELIVLMRKAEKWPHMSMRCRRYGGHNGPNKTLVVNISGLNASDLCQDTVDQMVEEIVSKGRAFSKNVPIYQAVASSRIRPHKWIVVFLGSTSEGHAFEDLIGDLEEHKNFGPTQFRIPMSEEMLHSEIVEALFRACRIRGIDLALVFVPNGKKAVVHSRVKELGRMSFMVTQMFRTKSAERYNTNGGEEATPTGEKEVQQGILNKLAKDIFEKFPSL